MSEKPNVLATAIYSIVALPPMLFLCAAWFGFLWSLLEWGFSVGHGLIR